MIETVQIGSYAHHQRIPGWHTAEKKVQKATSSSVGERKPSKMGRWGAQIKALECCSNQEEKKYNLSPVSRGHI